MTLFSVAILTGLPLWQILQGPENQSVVFASLVLLPLAVLFVAVFFVIRGYEITGRNLYVYRLGWKSTIDLTKFQSVEADAEAMKSSLRLFGNGGLFCFAGKFRNKRLGTYRAFATNPAKAVVLKIADSVVVVTPGDTEAFVSLLKSKYSLN